MRQEFVSLTSATGKTNPVGFNPCQGLYTCPDEGAKVAFIASHYNVDFSEHYLAKLLAARGFGFLGWNTRFRGNEGWFLLEHALLDIDAGVRWLHDYAGVETVVLLGNSGGGSLMAAYQSQAVEPNITPVADMKLPAAVEDLKGGDLYISLNAHSGRPEVLTDWMDPSVVDEFDPLAIDQSLNMYNPENGPPFSSAFVQRYRDAQKQRNHKITAWVLEEIERVKRAGSFERVFTMQRVWADLRLLDGSLDPSDREIGVCYAGDAKRANFDARGIGNLSSLRSWLSMWSLEYSSCGGRPHLQRIELPALVIQSMADVGVFPVDAKTIYEYLAGKDKTLEFVAGDHYLTSPDDARGNVTELIVNWVNERVRDL
jgi:pimeloyl-ACP methyl ester carboxylesterase